MLKNDVFDKNNSNSKLWLILAGYLTLTMHFDNMIQDSEEPKMASPRLPKNDVFDTKSLHNQ